MSVELLVDTVSGKTALFCDTTDVAFGPVFDSEEAADEFLELIAHETGGRDARTLTVRELEDFKQWADRNRRNREAFAR